MREQVSWELVWFRFFADEYLDFWAAAESSDCQLCAMQIRGSCRNLSEKLSSVGVATAIRGPAMMEIEPVLWLDRRLLQITNRCCMATKRRIRRRR